MDDEREGVHVVAGQQDVELHEVAGAVLGELVVQRGVALGAALELVEEVEDELGQRDVEPHLHRLVRQVVHVGHDAAVLHGQLHHGAGELGRHDDLGGEVGLLDVVDARDVGEVLGAADVGRLAVGEADVVVHRRARGDEVEVELALQALLDHLHVEEAEEAHAEAEAQGHGGLGLPHEGRVVDVQLLQGVPEVLVVLVVHREDAGVDHGLGLAVAGQRLSAGAVAVREGVAYAHALGVLEAGDHEAHLARAQLVHGHLDRALHAHAVGQEVLAGLHHGELVALGHVAVEHADHGHHAAVLVEVRVEHQRLEGRARVALGGRHEEDDGLEQVVDALAGLARHAHGVLGGDGQLVLDLHLDLVGVGARQVDLVDGRHDL